MIRLSTLKKLKLLSVAANVLLIIFGLGVVGLGVYIIIDHGDFSEIVGTYIYSGGVYLLIFVGAFVSMVAFVGFSGVDKGNRCLLITYIALIILLLILCFVGSVLVLSFYGAMNDAARDSMIKTLKDQYGGSRIITQSWDLMQSKLRCCAVDDNGWGVYDASVWDNVVNVNDNDRSQRISRTNIHYKLVPDSCCWTLVEPRTGWPTAIYRDRARCIHWQYGPALHPSGPHNDALYYRGCFITARDYMSYHASYIGGFGFGLLIVQIIALLAVFGVMVTLPSRKSEDDDIPPEKYYN